MRLRARSMHLLSSTCGKELSPRQRTRFGLAISAGVRARQCIRGPNMLMSIVGFILLALGAFNFTRGFFNSTRRGIMLDLCSGLVGAVAAGWLPSARGMYRSLRTTSGSERMLHA